jgi:hypothetical protein
MDIKGLLFGKKVGGVPGCTNAPSTICEIDTNPHVPEYMSCEPSVINEADLSGGVTITCDHASQPAVTNCDLTTDGIVVTCKFNDREVEFTPDANGHLRPSITLYEKLRSEVTCRLTSYLNPNTGDIVRPQGEDAAHLSWPCYGPSYIPEETDPSQICYSIPEPDLPTMFPNITNMVQGSDTGVTLTVSNMANCHGEPLSVTPINIMSVLHDFNIKYNEPESPRVLQISGSFLPSYFGGPIKFMLEDNDGNTKVYDAYPPLSINPLKVLTPDPYPQVGKSMVWTSQEVSGAVGYEFKIAKPDATDETLTADINHTLFTPDQTGWHTIDLSVTAYNGELVTATHNFFVYEPDTTALVPSLSIVAPYSGTVSTPINFQVGAPDTVNFDYSWNFGDSTPPAAGTDVLHTFTSTGTFAVILTAALKTDPSITYSSAPHNVSVSTTPVPLPVITHTHDPLSGPGSGYNIDFDASGSYSPIGARITNYQIIFAGGTPPSDSNSTGIFNDHTYPNPGPGNSAKYSVYLTITDEYGVPNSTSLVVTVWGD